ncbi:MAG TPA: diguanylate cyclase, partial [Negativicutes bacterium]|nr:diguanylate cyclase [Negativicutes bacterium]
RLLAVFPYDYGSIFWSDDLLTSEVFVCAGPALNSFRGIYWSNVYADVAGRGLTCSAVIPIYDGADRFRAIVGFDFTVDNLMTYLQGQDLAIGTPFLVNRAGQLLAHPTLVRSSDKEVRWMSDALPSELRQDPGRLLALPDGRFLSVGGAYVAAFDLDVAPWRLLFVVDKRSLALTVLGDMYVEMVLFVLLLLAMLFFLKIDRLSAALRKVLAAVESSDVAVLVADSRGVIEFVNRGFCEHTGYDAAEALGQTPRLLKSGETSPDTYRELWQTVTDGRSWHGDLLNRRKDGTVYWAATDISPILNSQGKVTHYVSAQLDVTENRRLEEELARLAVTDPLSGLANRRRFMTVLQNETERTRRSGIPFALLMFDIDHFKLVNDRYGHSMGDKAIVALANIMGAETREIDTVGRLGGEEFGVILPATGLNEAVAAAERIRQAVEGMDVTAEDGKVFRMTVSVGAAVRDGDIDPEELLRRADSALYASKNAGRNRVTPYRIE